MRHISHSLPAQVPQVRRSCGTMSQWRELTPSRRRQMPGYLPYMRDTTDAAEDVRLAAVRRLTPAERLRQMFELSESMRQVALAGLRQRHPRSTDLELVERLLGHTLIPPDSRSTAP